MHVVASHQNLKSFFRALGHKEEKVRRYVSVAAVMYVLSCSSVAAGWHAGEDY